MSPKADEYRRKAKVAEALAESARDQNAKETYLEIAEQWRATVPSRPKSMIGEIATPLSDSPSRPPLSYSS
jgi:hypothetical protein